MKISVLKKIYKVAKIGDSLWDKFFLGLVIFFQLLLAKIGSVLPPVDIKIRSNNLPFVVHLSGGRDSLWILEEVFVQNEYALPEVQEPHVIVDLGANIGLTSLYFASQYPNARIYSVEADPDTYKQLCRNVMPFERITPIHAAIAAARGEVSFYQSASSVRSSLRHRADTDVAIRVPAITFDDLLRRYNLTRVDVCKFDIEGGEEELFKDGADERVDLYIGEIHLDLIATPKNDFLQKFKSFSVQAVPLEESRLILRAKKQSLVTR